MLDKRLTVWRDPRLSAEWPIMDRTPTIDWTGFDRNHDRLTGTDRL